MLFAVLRDQNSIRLQKLRFSDLLNDLGKYRTIVGGADKNQIEPFPFPREQTDRPKGVGQKDFGPLAKPGQG